MSSMFTSLFGGGGASALDTASTTLQISAMGTIFTGMISGLKSALSALTPDLAGLVDITPITDLLDQTSKLQTECKNMTTDQCATQQAQLAAEANTAQLEYYNNLLRQSIANLEAALTKVESRYAEIKAEQAVTVGYKAAPVVPKFEELIANIKGDITVLRTSVPYINPPANVTLSSALDSGSGSSSGSSRPDYAPPSVGTKTGYLNQLDQLNNTYDDLIGNVLDLNRRSRSFWTWMYTIFIPLLFYLVLIACMVLGGSIASNYFVKETFYMTRIVYFIYGFIFFPVPLFAAIVNPPYWVSGVMPLYPLTGTPTTTTATGTGTGTVAP